MGSQLEAYLHQTSGCTGMIRLLSLVGFLNNKNSHNSHTRITLGKRKVVGEVKPERELVPGPVLSPAGLLVTSSVPISGGDHLLGVWNRCVGFSSRYGEKQHLTKQRRTVLQQITQR